MYNVNNYYLFKGQQMTQGKTQFWVGMTLIWFSHLAMDFMIGIWSVYKTLATIDIVVAGLIASLGMFIGEGLQLVFGVLSDKGYQRGLLALGLGLTASIPFLSYVENEWALFLLVLCSFVGSGAFHPAASGLTMVGNYASKSVLISLFICGGMIGAASSQFVYTQVYQAFDGRTGFLAIPIVILAICCLCYRFPTGEKQTQKVNFKRILSAIKPNRFQLGLLYVIQVCLQMVILSFSFLLPDLLKIKGYEEWFCLGGGYFCFVIGSAVLSVPIGYLVDRIGYRLVLAGVVISSTCLLYLFFAMDSLTLVFPIVSLLLIGGGMGVIIPVIVSGGTQMVPEYARSFVSAIYMGGASCLAGFGPIITSLIAVTWTEGEPIAALQILSLLLILSIGLIYFLPSHQIEENNILDPIRVRG
jgi:MFS transporter, FSR family, fosmidomycin resistance protein